MVRDLALKTMLHQIQKIFFICDLSVQTFW